MSDVRNQGSALQDAMGELIEGTTVKRSRHDLRWQGASLAEEFRTELKRRGYLPLTVDAASVEPGERAPAFYLDGDTAYFGWIFWEKFSEATTPETLRFGCAQRKRRLAYPDLPTPEYRGLCQPGPNRTHGYRPPIGNLTVPELPDLVYINTYLDRNVRGRRITALEVRQPVVIRNPFPEPPEAIVTGSSITATGLRGPFLLMRLSTGKELVLNLMLAGRLHHHAGGETPPGWRCVSIVLDDGSSLHLTDEQKMAKLYLAEPQRTRHIPRFDSQGVDILSATFTEEVFIALAAKHRRKQVRVFLNDHTILSAIGNAYADEILFEARIHPKTLVASLESTLAGLFDAVGSTIRWGIEEVARAQQPIHIKVRDHMKVRNRKGVPCVRCGTTIRREGVRGYDVFFCPMCQPPTRKSFIDWRDIPGSG